MDGNPDMLAGMMGDFGLFLNLVLEYFLKPFSRFHWPYMVASLVFAVLAWLIYERRLEPEKRTSLFKFLFPKSVWLHPSAILDYKYVVIDKLIVGIFGATATILAGKAVYTGSAGVVDTAFDDKIWVVILYTISLLLMEDFFRYWMHRLMHTVPVLWEFHKVHHSPEVLVPFSLLRTHPVNGILNLSRTGAAIILTSGLFLYLFPDGISVLTIFGVNVGRVMFNLMGAHLRHSHIWLGYGPVLSRLVISPCMHQVHHSKAKKHFNKNYGSQFAVWDWVFGTLYIPGIEERGTFQFGIGNGDKTQYRTVADLYFVPFRQAWARIKEGRAWSWAKSRQVLEERKKMAGQGV